MTAGRREPGEKDALLQVRRDADSGIADAERSHARCELHQERQTRLALYLERLGRFVIEHRGASGHRHERAHT